MSERIAEVGYINEYMEHALISIYEPPLLNPSSNGVQVVLSIEGAIILHAHLGAFLEMHLAGKLH